jgi:hypothetical protein
MPAVVKQTWSDFISVIAVWATGVFGIMFWHRQVGIESALMPQIVFGSFLALVVLAPIGSLVWRRWIWPRVSRG